MGRKSTARASASAAAAAANSAAPTFTSFAAATAQALSSYPRSNSATAQPAANTMHAPSQWDADALQLLKKLSKRDATTKVRALQDLTTHIESMDELSPGVGSVFVSAWGEAFRSAVLDDSNPAVRTSLLNLMGLVVAKFRRLVQPIFPAIFPAWVAAQGDLTAAVREAAALTISEALPSATQRAKVIDRYGEDLRSYCDQVLTALASGENPDNFLLHALRIIAVLSWLVDVAGSPSTISAVIDSPSNPLMLLSRGPKSKKKLSTSTLKVGAMREVCELAVKILAHMCPADKADQNRAMLFAELGLLGIRKNELSSWDLVLVLLRNGWHKAFKNGFAQLALAVGDAVTAPVPIGLSALLPLFDALPAGSSDSVDLSERVLSRMRKALHPSVQLEHAEESSAGTQVASAHVASVSYIHSALPAYIETLSFAYSTGSKRWLSELDAEHQEQHATSVVVQHLLPTLQLFLSGHLPPVFKTHQQSTGNSSTARRKLGVSGNTRTCSHIALAVARSIDTINHEVLLSRLQAISTAFVLSLSKGVASEVTARYESLLDALSDVSQRSALATAVFENITSSIAVESLEFHLAVLALTLSKGLSCSTLKPGDSGSHLDGERLIRELLQYISSVWSEKCGRIDLEEGTLMTRSLGEIYSWLYSAGTCLSSAELVGEVWQSLGEAVDRRERWVVLAETISAHDRRRKDATFSPWSPIRGHIVEEQVLEGAAALGEPEDRTCGLQVVTAASELDGGADVPVAILTRVAEMVLGIINESDGREDAYDKLLAVFLKSHHRFVEEQGPFQRLAALAVLRAAESKDVLSSLLAMVGTLPLQPALKMGESILEVLDERLSTPVQSDGVVLRRSQALAHIMLTIGENAGPAAAGTLCDTVFSWNNRVCTVELLRVVPLAFIFGNGVADPFRHEQFLEMISALPSLKDASKITLLIQTFVASLDPEEIQAVFRSAVKKSLSGNETCLRGVAEYIFSEQVQGALDMGVLFKLIAQDILAVFSSKSGSARRLDFERVPKVVSLLVAHSHGSCLLCFEEILVEAVKQVRRDPFSRTSIVAIGILSASLSASGRREALAFTSSLPKWLPENIELALLAVRRSLERALGASIEQIRGLEMHSARLLSCAIETFEACQLDVDNLRFWTPRIRDILEACVKENCNYEGGESKEWKRQVSVARLGSVLLESTAVHTLLRSDMLKDIRHYGAWATVGLLPLVDQQEYGKGEDLLISNCRPLSKLVINAAENDALVKSDGRIPVDVDRVYSLVPLLSSASVHVRKAVLTLLAYTTAMDLPSKVSSSFPKEGFGDETEEAQFSVSILPEPLRIGLEWGSESETDVNERGGSFAFKELGFFLSWRLFLDIIRAEDSAEGSTFLVGAEEDTSLRRVGTTFMRTHPEIYAEFFRRCTDVVVDGNPAERVAAGTGAEEALQAEERAAQGIQLVKQQTEPGEKSRREEQASGQDATTGAGEMNLDAEVGRAAGIAFARALQRLPALSRQHVTDHLDRGTALRVESFVRKRISPLLIATEIRKVKEWGAFGGGGSSSGTATPGTTLSGAAAEFGAEASATAGLGDSEGELHARGSVAGREVWATYTFSDVTLEIGMRLPDVFPLQMVEVEARSRIGMSEARWRKTLLGITTLLRAKDGTLAEAVELWRRNLDKTFQGAEECPICYSVLHLTTAALPKMQCRTCKNLFHADCMCKWFTKSNSSACPLCRSAF